MLRYLCLSWLCSRDIELTVNHIKQTDLKKKKATSSKEDVKAVTTLWIKNASHSVSQQHRTQKTKNCIVPPKPDELMATSCRLSAPRTAAVQTSLWSCSTGAAFKKPAEDQRCPDHLGGRAVGIWATTRSLTSLLVEKKKKKRFPNPTPPGQQTWVNYDINNATNVDWNICSLSRVHYILWDICAVCFWPCCKPLWVNQQPAKQNSTSLSLVRMM